MKQNPFDDIIQQKAGNHKAPVPADAWKNIEKMKRKRRPAAFWWLSGLLLFIGLGTFSYYMVNRSTADKGTISRKINATDNDSTGNSSTNKNNVSQNSTGTRYNANTPAAAKTITGYPQNISAVTKSRIISPATNTADKNFNSAQNDIASSKRNSYRKIKTKIAGKFAVTISPALQTTGTDKTTFRLIHIPAKSKQKKVCKK